MLRLSWVVAALLVVMCIGVIAYWQLVVAEGAYLGRRIVTLLYDRFAPRYDAVKQFNPLSDTVLLAAPVLEHKRDALVLDVATGTGRLPLTLLLQPAFTGSVDALDASGAMLNIARGKLKAYGDRVRFWQRDALVLPFPDEHFDVVTCLEALEFMPDWRKAAREMLRVLKPGGLILLSNRIGPDAWKLPGRALPTARFVTELAALGVTDLQSDDWLVDYDLVRGRKR
jgi:ubiquinone/menaquinone biosynthesis C-methylase UbiE